MNDSVVAIVSAFFIIGFSVGIIAVIAVSVLRADRRGSRGGPAGPPGYRPPGPGEQSSELNWGDAGPDDRPRWPGDGTNDFSGG